MKKVLITGANSYIGMSLDAWLSKNPEQYQVDTLDMIDGSWREKSFTGYDTVFHVAGIAHQKEIKENAHLYYEVNRDLAVNVALKAKLEGVKQFIFLSSMSVYGMDTGVITKQTVPAPKSNYGKSKLEAEEELQKIADDSFLVCILRPPMVYGKGCKGNFQTVIKLVKKLPVFPKVKNQRSMIYIDNLSNFVKIAVDEELSGFFFPQNKRYINTSEMAGWIAEKFGKKIFMSLLLGFGVKILQPFVKIAGKGFGSLVYVDTEDFEYSYIVLDNEKSIKASA